MCLVQIVSTVREEERERERKREIEREVSDMSKLNSSGVRLMLCIGVLKLIRAGCTGYVFM